MHIIKNILRNKLVNNFIVLISGDAFVSLLNIVSTAIIVNAIGLDKNGMILMIQTYALFFDQAFNFKSFQALIKYLSHTISKKDYEKTKFYIKQSLFLDFMTALMAVIVGYISINFVMKIMGWDMQLKPYIYIFMITVLFNLSGTCIGILRIFNKFNYITYINMIIAVIRFLLFVVGFILKEGFIFFFFVELIQSIVKNVLYMIFAYKTLRENNLSDFHKSDLKVEKGFFMFNLYSNLSSTIDLPVGTLTTFIINKYLGFEMISVYKIFEKIGSLVGRLSEPLNQIIYPELNSLISNDGKHAAKKLVKKLTLGIGGLGIVLILGVLVTYKLWLWIFIPNYSNYIGSLLIYLIFIIFINVTASFHSLFIALGYIKYTFPILIGINSLYCLCIIPVVKYYSLNGVILALLVQAALVVFFKLLIMKKVKNPQI